MVICIYIEFFYLLQLNKEHVRHAKLLFSFLEFWQWIIFTATQRTSSFIVNVSCHNRNKKTEKMKRKIVKYKTQRNASAYATVFHRNCVRFPLFHRKQSHNTYGRSMTAYSWRWLKSWLLFHLLHTFSVLNKFIAVSSNFLHWNVRSQHIHAVDHSYSFASPPTSSTLLSDFFFLTYFSSAIIFIQMHATHDKQWKSISKIHRTVAWMTMMTMAENRLSLSFISMPFQTWRWRSRWCRHTYTIASP